MPDSFHQIYGKYFAKLPDKNLYLERIRVNGEAVTVTKKGLDRLQFAHLCAVPFENLDIFDYGIKIDFGIEETFDKVVTRRRGGYCFELNALYMALLAEVGFEVYPVGVRIIIGEERAPAIAHRASIAVIDGKRYFSDVGFGMTNSPGASICVDDYGEQDVRGDIYKVEDRPYNHKTIIRRSESGDTELFTFIPDPFNILDFIAYNALIQTNDFFCGKRMANLRAESGSLSIDGGVFRRTENGERVETPLLNGAEALKIINEEFGMRLTEPLKDIA